MKSKKRASTFEQHIVNAQVSVNRAVAEINIEFRRGMKPNKEYILREIIAAIDSLGTAGSILSIQVKK